MAPASLAAVLQNMAGVPQARTQKTWNHPILAVSHPDLFQGHDGPWHGSPSRAHRYQVAGLGGLGFRQTWKILTCSC